MRIASGVSPERETSFSHVRASWGSHQLEEELRVFVPEHGVDALHLVGDAALGVIQALDEVVSVLRHQVSETEEGVGFGVLCGPQQDASEPSRTSPSVSSSRTTFLLN